MRILHVPHAYAPVIGGAERYVTRLSEVLSGRGHDVGVFTSDFSSPEGFYESGIPRLEKSEIGDSHGVEVLRTSYGATSYEWYSALANRIPALANASRRPLRARWEHRYGTALVAHVQATTPDVLLVLPHLWINVRIALDRLAGVVPIVMAPLLHEHDPNWPFDEVRSLMRSADCVVALTEHERQRLREAYGVSDSKLFYVGGGVDLPSLNSRVDRHNKRVMYLGRRTVGKGLELLLSAFEKAALRDRDLELVIAGGETSDSHLIDRKIEAMATSVQSRIEQRGPVSEQAKADMLRSSSCLVLPSSNESLGIVILEAWANETPVIAMDTPVLRSVVDHSKNGLLVGDAGSMSEAILSLTSNVALARAMGRQGRLTAVEGHDWDDVARRFEVAYLSVIRSNA